MYSTKFAINGKTFSGLVAETSEEQELGLMYKKPPAPTMLFLYFKPRDVSFWMKNTPAKLDIVFCKDGKVIDIKVGEPMSTTLIKPNSAVDLVIEFNYGIVSTFGFKIGDSVIVGNK